MRAAVFPDGATEGDLVRIVRPRPGLPFTPVVLGGRHRLVWTTFTSHQVDLDVRHPVARRYLGQVLRRLADAGVTTVRLDAVGYAVKTPGTSCFLTADTTVFIDDITAEARRLGMRVLAEVHAPNPVAADAAAHVDEVYDFVLAPLILHALFTGDTRPLTGWLTGPREDCVTVLDTHDGIGLIDAAGQLTAGQTEALAATVRHNSGGTSTAGTVPGGRLYQLSCTAYDALGRDDRRYLLARLLQLFVPGTPQIYYVGLLAGHNTKDCQRAGDPREINRRAYTDAEVRDALRRPVVRALIRLIRLRRTHPAFRGEFTVAAAPPGELRMAWRADGAGAELRASLGDASYELTLTSHGRMQTLNSAGDGRH